MSSIYFKKNEKDIRRARDNYRARGNYFLRLGSHHCSCGYFSGYSLLLIQESHLTQSKTRRFLSLFCLFLIFKADILCSNTCVPTPASLPPSPFPTQTNTLIHSYPHLHSIQWCLPCGYKSFNTTHTRSRSFVLSNSLLLKERELYSYIHVEVKRTESSVLSRVTTSPFHVVHKETPVFSSASIATALATPGRSSPLPFPW